MQHNATHCNTLQHLGNKNTSPRGMTFARGFHFVLATRSKQPKTCSIPHHTAMYHIVLQHTATHCNAGCKCSARASAVSCKTLQHSAAYTATYIATATATSTATHYNTLHHTTTQDKNAAHVRRYSPPPTATYCNTLQHNATHYYTL